jgi:hypothetical protein
MASSTTSLSNSEYRSVKAWSNSDISMVKNSPALLEWSKNSPQGESDASNIGTGCHSAVLEPDLFLSEYVKMPDYTGSKSGIASADLFRRNMQGKQVLTEKDYDLITGMSNSIFAHPVAKNLLKTKGDSEVSVFFEVDGVKCKARFDRMPDHKALGFHCVVDLKTTEDMNKFKFSVRDYGYDRQAAWYSNAYFELTGHYPRFIFVVVSKKKTFGRHEVRVFELTKDDVNDGWIQCLDGLEKIKEYEEFGVVIDVEVLTLPKKWN